jgi:putative folate metabolism gamma-glutamate ligase
MQVSSYKTNKIKVGDNLYKILDDYLQTIGEKTIVVITSKIISLCQKNIVENYGRVAKVDLIKKEADWYFIDEQLVQFGTVIPTIKNNILIANAGIDESNADGVFVFWPKNIDQVTETIWEYLRQKHNVSELGVLVTDSCLSPMRYGTHGVGISWCGFDALTDYRKTPDIFGRDLRMTLKNNVDGFSSAAVVVMGEGSEQTPLATITDIPFVVFQDRVPTKKEREKMLIQKEDDIYGKLLTSVAWKKGGENI